MFGKKKEKGPVIKYDSATMKPVLHCSICNGEQVFGFKNLSTGEFLEVSLIRNQAELEAYMQMYNLTGLEKEY